MNKTIPMLHRMAVYPLPLLLSACVLTPNLAVKPSSGPDETGAMKYQLWTAYIHVSPFVVKEIKQPGDVPEFDLKGEVARSPYKPILLMGGEDGFFQSTKVTYTTLKNTQMPEKLTVAVEDKVEKRIEQAGALAKTLAPLLFLEVPGENGLESAKSKQQKAIAAFKPWSINLAPAVASTTWTDKEFSLTAKEGIGAAPEGWEYTLDIGPASTTAIAIDAKEIKGLEKMVGELGKKGILIYPSCRAATLRLTHKGASVEWVKSFAIPDPRWVETAKLPTKGSITFNDCSVTVEPGDQDQRDYFAYVVKVGEAAAGAWEAAKEKKK